MRILVAGVSIRYIAQSAAMAGHSVIAADCYCDLDLERCAGITARLSLDDVESSLNALIREFSPEAIVLGTGFEELDLKGVPVLNNPRDKAAMVSDKLWTSRWLEKKGYPSIPTLEPEDCRSLPVVVKPRRGAGGLGCKLFRSYSDLNSDEEMIVQPFIEGRPASASVIAASGEAQTIAVNEQIIGALWAGAGDFKYAGNITPLEPGCPEIAEMAESIVAELGLVGSNGVDFLLTDVGPVVVEVNPRFQGSLDAVELSVGMNVFQAHLQAFQGLLPPKIRPRISAGRAIIYAMEDTRIEREMGEEWIRDIPRPGALIKRSMPICSILATGGCQAEVMSLLKERALMVYPRSSSRGSIG